MGVAAASRVEQERIMASRITAAVATRGPVPAIGLLLAGIVWVVVGAAVMVDVFDVFEGSDTSQATARTSPVGEQIALEAGASQEFDALYVAALAQAREAAALEVGALEEFNALYVVALARAGRMAAFEVDPLEQFNTLYRVALAEASRSRIGA